MDMHGHLESDVVGRGSWAASHLVCTGAGMRMSQVSKGILRGLAALGIKITTLPIEDANKRPRRSEGLRALSKGENHQSNRPGPARTPSVVHRGLPHGLEAGRRRTRTTRAAM